MSNQIELLDIIKDTKNILMTDYKKDDLIYFDKKFFISKSAKEANNFKNCEAKILYQNSNEKNIKQEYLNSSDNQEISIKNKMLNDLKSEYQQCKICRLNKKIENIFFGSGNPDSKLMIISDLPAADDRAGIPFSGVAGELLDKMLIAINIKRADVFITYILKCKISGNRSASIDEIANCSAIIKKEIEIIAPKYILSFGDTAIQFILNRPEAVVSKLRGKYYEINIYENFLRDRNFAAEVSSIIGDKILKTIIVPTYHPALLLKNEAYKKPAWIDLQLLRKKMIDDSKK